MPNRNKTGPNGDGPRTGRGLGDCLDKKVENSPRRGRGFGRGRGRCQRYWDNSDEEPRFGRGFGRGRYRRDLDDNDEARAGIGRGRGGLGRGPCAYRRGRNRND